MTAAPARRGRARWVLVLLTGGLLLAAGALPVWVRAAGRSALTGEVPVLVTGSAAAPAVPAAALVVLAAGVAVPLAGRLGRWLVVLVVGGAGALAAGAAVAVLVDPGPAARVAAAAGTGVTGLARPATTTAWPWLTVLVGAALVALAAALARASSRWTVRAGRYERGRPAPGTAVEPPDDDRAAWDALTRGEDPTAAPPAPRDGASTPPG